MRIRHTVLFTFYDITTQEQIADIVARLNDMGEFLQIEFGVTEWVDA